MRVIVLFLFLITPHVVVAEWIAASGSIVFPPTMAEVDACQQAEDRARTDAIRHGAGEIISAEEWMQCDDRQDQDACVRNASIWGNLTGYIKTIRNRTAHTSDDVAGYRRCSVGFDADVIPLSGRADPNFTLSVTLNNTLFRDGELLSVDVIPSQPMNIQVFQWLPYEKTSLQVQRLFPNGHDPETRITTATTLPRLGYAFKAVFPTERRKDVVEYILVIASRTPLSLQPNYSFEDFIHLVAELPQNDSRLMRRSYSIVRGE